MTLKQKFKSSIKRGTGEAYLILKRNPEMDFSNEIIKASLTNYAYDGQSEGSRATYIYELIQQSKHQTKIRNAILKGLATERQDTWNLSQLFELSAIYAKQGNTKAKQEIYKQFYNRPIEYSEWLGQDEIIELDGLEGLKYIAKIKGKVLADNPDEWNDSYVIGSFQEENPELKVYKELEKSGKKDKYIKAYLKNIERINFDFPEIERPKYNYEIVTEKINSKAIVPLPPRPAKDLSKIDIKKLADDFLKEKNKKKIEKYMRVFDLVKFPYNYTPLLLLAQSEYNRRNRLVEYACRSLKYFKGSDIRKFAIEKIKSASNPQDYLYLFVSNYRNGDCTLLTSIVNKYKNEDRIHSLVYGYICIYEKNKTRECLEPLKEIYDKLTCGLHRKDIIKIMIDNKVLPPNIKEEIQFDSNEDIRELYKNGW